MPKRCSVCGQKIRTGRFIGRANICTVCVAEHARTIQAHKIVRVKWNHMYPWPRIDGTYYDSNKFKNRPGIVLNIRRTLNSVKDSGTVFKVLFGIEIVYFNSCHLEKY